ncbi:MAG: hypothetical protein GY754_03235 [bacterium]|nr:hypothetical protein [bacterium]
MKQYIVIIMSLFIFSCLSSGSRTYRVNKGTQRGGSTSTSGSTSVSVQSENVKLKLVTTSIPQGAGIDIHEWLAVTVSYSVKNYSPQKKYRLYLVGRNTHGSDTLFLASKWLENANGSHELRVQFRTNHMSGFGKKGRTMQIFVKLDVTVGNKFSGKTAAKLALRYKRGRAHPVKKVMEKPSRNITVNLNGTQVTLRKGKQVIWHANGKLKHGFLHKPAAFKQDGITITAGVGMANITKEGKLKSTLNLHTNTMLKANGRKLLFLQGNSVVLYHDGSVSVGNIAQNYTFDAGDHEYNLKRGALVGFFMDTKIRIVKTAAPQKVPVGDDEYTLPPGSGIFFRPNGLVDNLVGSRNLTFKAGSKNIVCAPGTAITFTPDGVLTGCRLAIDTPFTVKSGSFVAPAKSEILFYGDGTPESFKMKSNASFVVGGKNVLLMGNKDGTHFYKDGSVWMAYPAVNFSYPVSGGSIYVEKGEQIAFSEEGKLIWGTAVRNFSIDTKIGNITLIAGRTTHFHKSGLAKMGYLAKDAPVSVNGKKYVFQGGKFIGFHDTGMPSRASLAQAMMVRINWRGRMRNVNMRRGGTLWFDKRGMPKR